MNFQWFLTKKPLTINPCFLLRKWAKTPYSNVEFQNFLVGIPPDPPLTGEGKGGDGTGREGRGGHKGLAPPPRGKILSTPLQ